MYSWGNYPIVKHRGVVDALYFKDNADFSNKKYLAYGLGRSYGDACLNENGYLIDTSSLNKFINFNAKEGTLRVFAGVSLEDIIKTFVPKGWFLPVVPGTKFVTVGGAIANDIHGKNHHRAGTFGSHVTSLKLLRSDQKIINCSNSENSELFKATIGGLGLTGLILEAAIKLKTVKSNAIDATIIKFNGLDEFFELTESQDQDFEYTVAWLDCINSGNKFGRGHYICGNHAEPNSNSKQSVLSKFPKFLRSVPFFLHNQILNSYTIKFFNDFYYNRQFSKTKNVRINIDPFFFPLDSIYNWNKIYGKAGFFQFQSVIPISDSRAIIGEMLKVVVKSGQASFLAVIKKFGDKKSPGLLSFPRPGITLCMDFANRGNKTIQLLKKLEEITISGKGAIYPAKDALMSEQSFLQAYPEYKKFKEFIDPAFSSSFIRRVTGVNKL